MPRLPATCAVSDVACSMFDMSAQPEPRKRGTTMRDRDGDLWRRGNTRWTCLTLPDGGRVQQVGRLPWFALCDQYGPLTPEEAPTP